MAETTVDIDALDEENAPSSYTTETEESAPGRGQSITAPGSGLGRRKEAVARVRLVPGTGQWTLNGRSLEDYFPNKLHQQLVRAPFTILDLEGRFDVVARINSHIATLCRFCRYDCRSYYGWSSTRSVFGGVTGVCSKS